MPCTVDRGWAWLVQALPDLDANEVTIDGIWLGNEGWDRHGDVPEPSEPDVVVAVRGCFGCPEKTGSKMAPPSGVSRL